MISEGKSCAIIGLKVLVRWRCPNQVIRSAFLQVPISRVILVRYGGLRLAPHTGLPVVGLPDPIEGGHRVPVSRSARRLDACPTRLTRAGASDQHRRTMSHAVLVVNGSAPSTAAVRR